MEFGVFLSFVAATALMIALPGPSVLLTVAHSVSFGWKRALLTVLGATLGIAVQLLVAAVGIGTLIESVAAAFEIVRWAGAAYLIFLGVKTWINAKKTATPNRSDVRNDRLLLQGLVVTIFNPKSLIFMAAFLPQFVDVRRPLGIQFLVIIPVFLAITFLITSAWALLSEAAAKLIGGGKRLTAVFRVASVLIVGSGLGMILLNMKT